MLSVAPIHANGPTLLTQIESGLAHVVVIINVIGVLILLWGTASALIRFIDAEIRVLRGQPCRAARIQLRRQLGFYLTLGLEFLIASDIVESLIAPTWEHLGTLAAAVVIRTAISFSLDWELAQLDREASVAAEEHGPRAELSTKEKT